MSNNHAEVLKRIRSLQRLILNLILVPAGTCVKKISNRKSYGGQSHKSNWWSHAMAHINNSVQTFFHVMFEINEQYSSISSG